MGTSWWHAKEMVKAAPIIGPAARYVYRLFRPSQVEQQPLITQRPVAGESGVRLKYTSTVSHAEFQARCGENDFWYHSYYFDNSFAQRGDYDIGCDLADYGFPQDMSGMSVLDIGTGSGWFAAYFEQRGANVTVTDARGYCDFDVFGRDHYPDLSSEKPGPDRVLSDGRPVYYSPVSKGFWIMKDILGLKADYVNSRVYDIGPDLFGGRKFDLVFMGSLLMHLRDPIGGLMAAHRVCKGQLIATSYILPPVTSQSVSMLQALANNSDRISWWVPNRPGLIRCLQGAGFTKMDIDRKIRLTVDRPHSAEGGKHRQVNQVQQLIHAFV